MDAAHPLENQQLASVPHDSINPDLKPEERPATALVIELVPGENGVYKVASQAQGGVQLTDQEMAMVEHFRQQQLKDEADAKAQTEADANKTEVPAASLSDQEQSQLEEFKAWQAQKAASETQTGQTTGDGKEDYVPPAGG